MQHLRGLRAVPRYARESITDPVTCGLGFLATRGGSQLGQLTHNIVCAQWQPQYVRRASGAMLQQFEIVSLGKNVIVDDIE